MRKTRMDYASVTSSSTGSSASTHPSFSPLLARPRVTLFDLRIDRGAIAAVADGAACHASGYCAEHATRAAQVFIWGEDL